MFMQYPLQLKTWKTQKALHVLGCEAFPAPQPELLAVQQRVVWQQTSKDVCVCTYYSFD